MWRILVKWNFISPYLSVATGILKIEKYKGGMAVAKPEKSYTLNIKVSKGSIELVGLHPKLKDDADDFIRTMLRSYLDGLTLSDTSCYWFPENTDIIEK